MNEYRLLNNNGLLHMKDNFCLCHMTFASVETIGSTSRARSESLCRETLGGYALSVSTIATLLFPTIPADLPFPTPGPTGTSLVKFSWSELVTSNCMPIRGGKNTAESDKTVRSGCHWLGAQPLNKVLFSVTRWRWKLLMQALFWSLRLHSQGVSNQIAGIASPQPSLSIPPACHKMLFIMSCNAGNCSRNESGRAEGVLCALSLCWPPGSVKLSRTKSNRNSIVIQSARTAQ